MHRLAVLIGSRSALSAPVLIVLAIAGALQTSMYLLLVPDQSAIEAAGVAVSAAVITTGILVATRVLAGRDGWTTPHPCIVVCGLITSSLFRSFLTTAYVTWQEGSVELDSRPSLRITVALVAMVGLGLAMAVAAQLAHERSDIQAELLREQARLRLLVKRADAELSQVETELRGKAHRLLEPTIHEIQELVSGEISPVAAREIADRINAAISDVVRPVSHDLARSPGAWNPGEADVHSPAPPLSRDRMDVPKAIRPGWLLVAWWGVLVPGLMVAGTQASMITQRFVLSALTVPLLYGIKMAWPSRLRIMPVAEGLAVLFVLYCVLNLGVEILMTELRASLILSAPWTGDSLAGVLIRIAVGALASILALLVSVLAMLFVRGKQTRAALRETNARLEVLVARITRETWLLHRSVSLAVHGTVQSALVSTSMRLSAPDRTQDSILDARDRLERALIAISADHSDSGSLSVALTDLQGLWAPIVDISTHISPAAERHLAQDTGLRRCVIEICREAASNAIRHGHANALHITIDSADRLITIVVIDDGDGIPSVLVAGLGSQMLDSTTLRWTLASSPDSGAELHAVLA